MWSARGRRASDAKEKTGKVQAVRRHSATRARRNRGPVGQERKKTQSPRSFKRGSPRHSSVESPRSVRTASPRSKSARKSFALLAIETKALNKDWVKFDDTYDNTSSPIFVSDIRRRKIASLFSRSTSRVKFQARPVSADTLLKEIDEMEPKIEHIILFIHGFTLQPQHILQGGQYDLNNYYGPNTLVIPVIWPSLNIYAPFGYLGDRKRAETAGFTIAATLANLQGAWLGRMAKGKTPKARLHIFAHSMGAWVLYNTIRHTPLMNNPPIKFGAILMIAANAPTDVFTHPYKDQQVGKKLSGMCDKVIVTYTRKDKSLRLVNKYPFLFGHQDLGYKGPGNVSHLENVIPVEIDKIVGELTGETYTYHNLNSHPDFVMFVQQVLRTTVSPLPDPSQLYRNRKFSTSNSSYSSVASSPSTPKLQKPQQTTVLPSPRGPRRVQATLREQIQIQLPREYNNISREQGQKREQSEVTEPPQYDDYRSPSAPREAYLRESSRNSSRTFRESSSNRMDQYSTVHTLPGYSTAQEMHRDTTMSSFKDSNASTTMSLPAYDDIVQKSRRSSYKGTIEGKIERPISTNTMLNHDSSNFGTVVTGPESLVTRSPTPQTPLPEDMVHRRMSQRVQLRNAREEKVNLHPLDANVHPTEKRPKKKKNKGKMMRKALGAVAENVAAVGAGLATAALLGSAVAGPIGAIGAISAGVLGKAVGGAVNSVKFGKKKKDSEEDDEDEEGPSKVAQLSGALGNVGVVEAGAAGVLTAAVGGAVALAKSRHDKKNDAMSTHSSKHMPIVEGTVLGEHKEYQETQRDSENYESMACQNPGKTSQVILAEKERLNIGSPRRARERKRKDRRQYESKHERGKSGSSLSSFSSASQTLANAISASTASFVDYTHQAFGSVVNSLSPPPIQTRKSRTNRHKRSSSIKSDSGCRQYYKQNDRKLVPPRPGTSRSAVRSFYTPEQNLPRPSTSRSAVRSRSPEATSQQYPLQSRFSRSSTSFERNDNFQTSQPNECLSQQELANTMAILQHMQNSAGTEQSRIVSLQVEQSPTGRGKQVVVRMRPKQQGMEDLIFRLLL